MAEHDNAFDRRIRDALDISTPDLTPDPAIRADIRSRLRGRGSVGHLLGRNGFVSSPVGSWRAVAAAAALVVFALNGPTYLPVGPGTSDVAMAVADSAAHDSAASTAAFGLGLADSLLHTVGADSLVSQ